jgi:hypothetical protein
MAEPCFEIEGVCRETNPNGYIFKEWNFKASVGKSGFAYTVVAAGQSRPHLIMGGENGFVAAIIGYMDRGKLLGRASLADSVLEAGFGPGPLLYALFGNYSQLLKPNVQIPLVDMVGQTTGLEIEEVAQSWQFDSKFPFGANSMTAYVVPSPKISTNALSLYPEGWKVGEMKVIQSDPSSGIPLLVEATWSVRTSAIPGRQDEFTQPQQRDQVTPWVGVRLETTRITKGERDSYLPEIKIKSLDVTDQRARMPKGEFLDYSLKPGELWPKSDSPDFARKQSESLAAWKEAEKATRHPLLASTTMLIGSGIILIFIIRLSRPRLEKSTPQ